MSIGEDSLKSNGKPPGPWAESAIRLAPRMASWASFLQVAAWVGFLFSPTRSNELFSFSIIVAFTISIGVTYLAALTALTRTVSNRLVVVLIVNAFLYILVEFATLYWRIGTPGNFNTELSRIDAVYFTLGTLTTAGTGPLAPTSGIARLIVSGQMVLDMVFVAGAVTMAVTRWTRSSKKPK